MKENNGGDNSHVIFTVNEEIKEIDSTSVAILMNNGNEVESCAIAEFLTSKSKLDKSLSSYPEDIKKCIRDNFYCKKDNLSKELGLEMARQVLETLGGPLEVDILLNSPGGNAMTADRIIEAIDALKTRSGGLQINGYVTEEAFSAAAHLFEKTTNRIALPSSEFVWHWGSMGWDISKITDEAREELEMELDGLSFEDVGLTEPELVSEIRARLRESLVWIAIEAKPRRRARLRTNIKEQLARGTFDSEVRFTGDELYNYGVIHHLPTKRSDMARHFRKSLPGVHNTLSKWLDPNSVVGRTKNYFLPK